VSSTKASSQISRRLRAPAATTSGRL
jgi:hypothetical protein